MKTKEELNALKEEVETLNKKLHELKEEGLAQVTGGDIIDLLKSLCPTCDRFKPIDGNMDNRTYRNCTYGASAALHSTQCPGVGGAKYC